MVPNIAQATMVAMPKPPGSRPIKARATSNKDVVAPETAIIFPRRMKRGIAIKVKPCIEFVPKLANDRGPWPATQNKIGIELARKAT